MSSQKPNPASLFFLLTLSFLLLASFKLSNCIANKSVIFCPEIEKQALLSFKLSLEDPSNQLFSWNNGSEVNCCKWKGVICNNFTGHVHQLRLQNYEYPDFPGLSGKIHPSLLNLKQLKYLDLSQNNFGETIPSFFGSLTSLNYLNLSNAGFHEIIPHTIGNLSNLRTLDLEGDNLDVDSLEWLSGLSQLEHLNMNHVNLSAAANWAHMINTLPSLVELHFEACNLNFISDPLMNKVNVSSSLAILDLFGNADFSQSVFVPRWIFQLTNLTFLDLSLNYFDGPIPSISNTTKLQYINLDYNSLNSTIPNWLYSCKDLESVYFRKNSLHGTISNAIGNLTSLNILVLSDNELSGKIPREIASLCNMGGLDLSYNELQGEISDSFGNMSDCFLGAFGYLDLSYNQISGYLTDQFGELKVLQYLNLMKNSVSGEIPLNLGRSSSLKYLYLHDNKLIGNLPESLGQLFNLEYLNIEGNKLEGVVTERHFVNLTKLRVLSATGNHLTLKVNPNWIPPFKLEDLGLGSWNLGVDTKILSWLNTQKNTLYTLDLSDTGISGRVPSWLWRIPTLDLSHNHLHGKIPDFFGNQNIYLSSNQFRGSLPRVASTLIELDLSNNSFSGGTSHFLCDHTTNGSTYSLMVLHLGGNQLSGELPDCWIKWTSLMLLNLGNNNLSGSIPNSIGFLTNLFSLNLYNNKFSGQIPFSLHNCTLLMKIDLADNNLEGNMPKWIGTSLPNLSFLILRSNKLSGYISSDICHLNYLQILDLSNNQFSGIIPRCVDNFTAMATTKSLVDLDDGRYSSMFDGIRYSWAFVDSASVVTKGSESHYSTILGLVTNLDLSKNNLSGDIPNELTSLVELRSLNLSGNHLTGLIPNNIGDMKQLESLDFSINSLSGGIPDSFTTMSSLNHLNLSYNKLTGRIPESTQILSLDASSFIGNQLCGPPLTRNCSNSDEVPPPVNKEEREGSDKSKIDWFYVLLSSGFTAGFSVVCTTLKFNKSWRDAYFGFVEDMWNKLYVFLCIKWRRLARQ